MKAQFRNTNLVTEKPSKALLMFAFPIFVGNIFQQLYNIVDSIVVGNVVGGQALAAVGASAPVFQIFLGINSGLALGAGIIISQLVGAREEVNIQRTIFNTALLLLFSSVLLGCIGYIFADNLLRLFNTPETIIPHSLIYMRTIMLGSIGMAFYNMLAEIFRAFGDSRTPLYFLMLSSVIHIALDLIFVILFKLNIFGAALATIIAQSTSAICCYLYGKKHFSYFTLRKKDQVFDWYTIKLIFSTGIPLSLQNSMIGFSGAMLQGFVNGFGEVFVATNTVVSRFDSLQNMPYNSFSSALSVFTAQNIGAGKHERIKLGYKLALKLALIYSLILLIIGQTLNQSFMKLFISDPSIINQGSDGIRIITGGTLALGMIYIHRSILNGSGDTFFSMLGGFIEIIGRIGFAWLFVVVLQTGYWGIWYAMIANWILTGGINFWRFSTGKWKGKAINKKLVNQ